MADSSLTAMGPVNAIDEGIQKVKRKYDKAYSHINQALSLDEQRQVEQAIDNYVKGIRYMNCSLEMWSQLCQEHPRETQGSRMAPKMDRMAVNLTKAQRRVDELLGFMRGSATAGAASTPTQDQPPSYSAAMARQNLDPPGRDGAASAMTDAILLFFIEGGVQIYFIGNDGNVSAPSYPSSLAIYQFVDKAACQIAVDSPPAFLQVNDWIYPLVPTISPALHADWGAYVFPDVTAREEGCFVGVIIPDTLDSGKRQKLEEILCRFTNFKEQVPGTEAGQASSTSDTTSTISKGIQTASEWISWGVTKGAEKAGQWVKYGSEKLRQRMEPESEPSKIDPKVQKGAQYARVATGGAVKISAFLVDKVGQASSALARTVAPHVRRTSESLMPESWTRKNPSDGRSTLDKISEVASSSLQGFSTVYLGLERSAMILAKSVADQTVQTVQYKYGSDAGQLTDNIVYSATNVVMTTNTINHLGVQAIAKQVGKETGKEAIKPQGQRPPHPQQPPAEKNGQKMEPEHSEKKRQQQASRTKSFQSDETHSQSSNTKKIPNKKGQPPGDEKRHPPS